MSSLLLAGAAALGLALVGVYLRDLRLAYEFGESTKAIFAADAAVEYQLYKRYYPAAAVDLPVMTNNTTYQYSSENDAIRGIGESHGVRRGIEIYTGPESTY